MATRVENHCCDCAVPGYPCQGRLCPRRRVTVHYCDRCGEEIERVYELDGEELCEECRDELYGDEEDEE